MKRVVVTGATSMIGVALIKECIAHDIEVLAIVRSQSVRLSRLPKSDLIKLCECDIDQLAKIPKQKKEYDVFYHFGWDYTSKTTRNDPVLQEKNVEYTLEAVRVAKRLGCYKFIGAGSQAEYGKVDGVITSATPIAPLIAYGVAKYAAGRLSEMLCRQYEMVHIWGRIFSVYGRNDNEGTMLNYAIEQFLKGEPAKFSAATQMWDYLHEKDAGRIFYLLGEVVNENKVYCIANGESRQLKDFIMELSDLFNGNALCEFAAFADCGNLIGLQVDVGDLINDIAYTPKISFREGVEDMIKYRTFILGGGGIVNTIYLNVFFSPYIKVVNGGKRCE